MRLMRTVSIMIVAIAMFAAAGIAAQPKNSRIVDISQDVTVAGAHVSRGRYNISWQTHSPEATISFMKQGKVVASWNQG
jgi:hypothetical protein